MCKAIAVFLPSKPLYYNKERCTSYRKGKLIDVCIISLLAFIHPRPDNNKNNNNKQHATVSCTQWDCATCCYVV